MQEHERLSPLSYCVSPHTIHRTCHLLPIVPALSNHPSISTTSGESGELGRAINLDLKEAAEETTGDKPEYDLYRIWKEQLTPVSIFGCVCVCILSSPLVSAHVCVRMYASCRLHLLT